MTLNGQDFQRLRDAFVEAYDKDSLETLLRFQLNRRLDALVSPIANIEIAVFQLLDRAQKEGWLRELIEKAADERMQNAKFATLCRDVLVKYRSEPGRHRPNIGARPTDSTVSPDNRSSIQPEELRHRMTERLSLTEVGILWYDLFGTTLTNDLPGRSLSESVIELLARARQRNKIDSLLRHLDSTFPHALEKSADPQ